MIVIKIFVTHKSFPACRRDNDMIPLCIGIGKEKENKEKCTYTRKTSRDILIVRGTAGFAFSYAS